MVGDGTRRAAGGQTEPAPNPLVSVIVPVYDGEQFLGEAIESVLTQGYAPLEVVVVDDGSTDDSAAVAARLGAPVRVVRHDRNEGPAAARNTGVTTSIGELLTFLDADDRMAPGRLRTQVGHLLAHPECGYVNGRQEIALEPGHTLPSWLLDPGGAPIAVHPLSGMLRRATFERVGPFDETLRVGEDVDWLVSLRLAGVWFDDLDAVVVYRRVHDGNVSHRHGREHHDSVLLRAAARAVARRRSSRDS